MHPQICQKRSLEQHKQKTRPTNNQPSRNCKLRPDVQLTTCSFKGVQKGKNNYWSNSNGTTYVPKIKLQDHGTLVAE